MVVQVVQRAWTDAPSDTIRRDVRSNLQDVFFCLTKPTGWSGTQCSGISVEWFDATIDLLATPWVLEETHRSLLLPEEGRRKYIWDGKTEWKCEKQVNGMAKSA